MQLFKYLLKLSGYLFIVFSFAFILIVVVDYLFLGGAQLEGKGTLKIISYFLGIMVFLFLYGGYFLSLILSFIYIKIKGNSNKFIGAIISFIIALIVTIGFIQYEGKIGFGEVQVIVSILVVGVALDMLTRKFPYQDKSQNEH
ncbi:hypothetical protein [Mangrovivirga cuniculi]|uniref:Uncharacterized protein n=1 Tax=Mangrovivirga cuniculi TaxID=2715131 RepID=A0A4D7K1L5_9BACT|nr:hypothetical protein [Mangrovivirga cuniculi]QCK13338.1 hypothetical protein DCC35_00525 [Mangrovivirga cuniculi]